MSLRHGVSLRGSVVLVQSHPAPVSSCAATRVGAVASWCCLKHRAPVNLSRFSTHGIAGRARPSISQLHPQVAKPQRSHKAIKQHMPPVYRILIPLRPPATTCSLSRRESQMIFLPPVPERHTHSSGTFSATNTMRPSSTRDTPLATSLLPAHLLS